VTLREHQAKFIHMDALLVLKAIELNTPLVCLSYGRTLEEQRLLVARGASKTMHSQHLDWLAKDYCFLADLQDDGKLNYDAEKYRLLGEYWEFIGGEWGGRYGETDNSLGWDCGHFGYRKDKH
jgi:hypothetical protein